MADTNNLKITKPTVGGSIGTWGTELNTALDILDAHPGIKVVADTATRMALTPWTGQIVLQADTGALWKCTDTAGPVWTDKIGSIDAVMTAEGDMLYQGESAPARLIKGTAGQRLQINTGATAPEWADDLKGISFAVAEELAIEANVLMVVAPHAMTITGGKMAVVVAPAGASLICDVHKNGTTLFTTQANRPTIAASDTTASITAPDVANVAQGDLLTLDIDQIGSDVAGYKLSLTLYAKVAV